VSHLSKAIHALMKRRDLSQSELANRIGLNSASISNIIHGKRTKLRRGTLTKLASICADEEEQAELVAAQMLDMRKGPGARLVWVAIEKNGATPAATSDEQNPLPPDMDEALLWIRKHGKDRHVQRIILSTYRLLRKRVEEETP
jgi:transcriptional regulator with XRE-family HTH domain